MKKHSNGGNVPKKKSDPAPLQAVGTRGIFTGAALPEGALQGNADRARERARKIVPSFAINSKVLTSRLDLGVILSSEIRNGQAEYSVTCNNHQEIFNGSELAIIDWGLEDDLVNIAQTFGNIARSRYYEKAFSFLLDNYFQLSRNIISLTNENHIRAKVIEKLRLRQKLFTIGLVLAVLGNIWQWLV